MKSKLEIIAQRSLILSSDGTEQPVTVVIGRPYEELDGAHFCPYRITGVGAGETRRAGGVDDIQALQLAFVMIGAELSAYSDSLKWNGSMFVGFPKSIHDPIVGES